MTQTVVILMVIGLIAVGIWFSPWIWQQRRRRWQRRPFPTRWEAIVDQQLPFYARLLPAQQQQLQANIQVFLAEKQFIGCAGLQLTETMQVTIAAIACLLLLGEHGNYFPRLRSILVYPTAYYVDEVSSPEWGIIQERRVARLGESWVQDQVVLAWSQVAWDCDRWQDGHNVVLHEFAHQLDQADGTAEGVPILPDQATYQTWATVMSQAYQQLCQAVERGDRTVLDPYGTTNPAEFFAVATETFFEKPQLLRRHHPDLYAQLRSYYRLNPIDWI